MDPAFERRIQTHILFTMPDAEERKAIWRLQVHPDRTPLAPDVDFAALAAAFPASGGQIRNAVFKAAQMAAAGPGPDRDKHITQAHLRAAMEDVVAAERVMRQSLYTPEGLPAGLAPLLRRPGEASIVLAGIALALALLALVLAVVI
jgi:ATP-dependent 26S proteasome regulatory subunit